MTVSLTTEQLEKFHRDGYLVIPEFLTEEDVSKLRRRADELVEAFDPSSHPISLFTASGQSAEGKPHSEDDYFLESGDKIRYFLETKSVDPANPRALKVKPHQAVNKIGHGLHLVDHLCRRKIMGEPIQSIAKQLHINDPRVLQSMYIFKQPNIGGEVPPHQDSSFLHTTPLSAIGFWFALEDCTPDNGCLAFVPGSHDREISQRYIRVAGPPVKAILVDAKTGEEGKGAYQVPSEDYKLAPCPKGSLVLIHGSVLHRSSANTSMNRRLALTFHVIEGTSKYSADNWYVLKLR
ncbi:phytanoyl-CoA dioxygenase family protein [Piptocephalis cylindrospora]|uniref:Phytanoyl-CoA dioxygenase family protein n=1 Tax=Piptocephalis cylindrospora TaxID=1907219 RepID=A0A4P9YAS1_9FUNG|nr:phytanoyl-CoA dioxygenase family protein [Piptocephalis cylindrospora]|eukprot:RKP15200.1 phytanoyl-CoA dioxygenase family protein [Piptocephalis cylindrospora]